MDAAVVRVEGEVDISSASHLVQAIAQAYRVIRCVIVDLTDLAYLDGSGIRVLQRASRANRGRFVVVASTRNILRIFEVMNLLDELPVTSSVRAAQEYLRLQEMGECGGT